VLLEKERQQARAIRNKEQGEDQYVCVELVAFKVLVGFWWRCVKDDEEEGDPNDESGEGSLV